MRKRTVRSEHDPCVRHFLLITNRSTPRNGVWLKQYTLENEIKCCDETRKPATGKSWFDINTLTDCRLPKSATQKRNRCQYNQRDLF